MIFSLRIALKQVEPVLVAQKEDLMNTMAAAKTKIMQKVCSFFEKIYFGRHMANVPPGAVVTVPHITQPFVLRPFRDHFL